MYIEYNKLIHQESLDFEVKKNSNVICNIKNLHIIIPKSRVDKSASL